MRGFWSRRWESNPLDSSAFSRLARGLRPLPFQDESRDLCQLARSSKSGAADRIRTDDPLITGAGETSRMGGQVSQQSQFPRNPRGVSPTATPETPVRSDLAYTGLTKLALRQTRRQAGRVRDVDSRGAGFPVYGAPWLKTLLTLRAILAGLSGVRRWFDGHHNATAFAMERVR